GGGCTATLQWPGKPNGAPERRPVSSSTQHLPCQCLILLSHGRPNFCYVAPIGVFVSLASTSEGERGGDRPDQIPRIPELQPPRRDMGQVVAFSSRRLPHRQGHDRTRDTGRPGAEDTAPDLPRP